jgi:SAM-dependent methyltransferase
MKIQAMIKKFTDDPAALICFSALKKALTGKTIPRNSWNQTDGFKVRRYSSYEEYLTHQRSKLTNKLQKEGEAYFSEYDQVFYNALHSRLGQGGLLARLQGKSVLCLAARLGTEVRAFLDRGAFAIGIDLNPGGPSRYVLEGDFHQMQFPDKSVDVIYTNSLDHLYDKDKLAGEIWRVLKKSGIAIIEAFQPNEDIAFGSYESFNWSDVGQLEEFFLQRRFILKGRTTFALPWCGTQLVFAKSGD